MASWDESKRRSNLRDHGLDFVGADAISLRKAEPYEARYYLEAAEEHFQTGRGS
jgi:uncharacterized DUF497 family protein